MLYSICRFTAYCGRLFFSRTFPADLQQFIQRTLWETIMGAPVVSDSCTRNEKEPFVHTMRAKLLIHATHCFEKDVRGQVFGIFSIADLAIHIAIDRSELLLIKPLEFLPIHSNSPDGL